MNKNVLNERIDPVEMARGLFKKHGNDAIKIVEAVINGHHYGHFPKGGYLAQGNGVEDGVPNKKFKTRTFWFNVLGYLRNKHPHVAAEES